MPFTYFEFVCVYIAFDEMLNDIAEKKIDVEKK